MPQGSRLHGLEAVPVRRHRTIPTGLPQVPNAALTGFPAAATGLSTCPPSQKELLKFTKDFLCGFRCHEALAWGPNKINTVVDRFCKKFPRGSWVMFWGFLAWQISDVADSKIAHRASADLQRFISYADPTGDMAVRNVMRSS